MVIVDQTVVELTRGVGHFLEAQVLGDALVHQLLALVLVLAGSPLFRALGEDAVIFGAEGVALREDPREEA